MEERLLTEKEVSDLTSISLAALRNWRVKRKAFPFCKIGKSVRYPLKDLVSYLEKHKQCRSLRDTVSQKFREIIDPCCQRKMN